MTEFLALEFDNGNSLFVTSEHPIWRGGDTFSPVGELRIGDAVFTHVEGGWDTARVTSIRARRVPEHVLVYNIEVEKYHTYIAGGVGAHYC